MSPATAPRLGGAEVGSLQAHKLAAIEFRQIDITWPRHVGKNSRRDVHGFGPKPTIAVMKTNQGAIGWGMITGGRKNVEDLQPTVMGRTVADLIDPGYGIRSRELRPLDIPLHDLAGVILGQPVWKMLGGTSPGPLRIYSGMVYFDDLEPSDKPAGVKKVLENARWDFDYGSAFDLTFQRDGEWYKHFVEQFEQIWADAKPWTPTSGAFEK